MQCFAVWAAAVFQVRQVPHACVVCGLGVDEARIFCGLSALLVVRVFAKCVCVLVCFVLWHAVGCLGQHRFVVLKNHPLM